MTAILVDLMTNFAQLMSRNIALSIPSFNLEDEEAITQCLRSGWVMQGPLTQQFEQDFANYIGAQYAVALTSCTTALHLMMLSMGIGEGDEVLVPAFSWVSTANAVEYVGAKPIFIDIDETFNLDLDQVEQAITSNTKAIIPVHLFGLCVDVTSLKQRFPNLHIVEDAACAAGASINGMNAGIMGEMAAFSFHPRKSITTGEGGMITTNSKDHYEALLALRNHGLDPSFQKKNNWDMPQVDVLGYNFRMTDIQSSIGITQLRRLDQMIEERQAGAQIYQQLLGGNDRIILPANHKGIRHSWQSYVVLLDEALDRNNIMHQLANHGIATRPGTQALHMLDYYAKKYQISPEDFPTAKRVYEQSIAIPMHNKMSEDDYDYVGNQLNKLIKA